MAFFPEGCIDITQAFLNLALGGNVWLLGLSVTFVIKRIRGPMVQRIGIEVEYE
ncbi:MAG: hypothetical protein ACOZF2_06140 [Thermodesulfobacteriota bacterium]